METVERGRTMPSHLNQTPPTDQPFPPPFLHTFLRWSLKPLVSVTGVQCPRTNRIRTTPNSGLKLRDGCLPTVVHFLFSSAQTPRGGVGVWEDMTGGHEGHPWAVGSGGAPHYEAAD
ncbi:hypothetical protein DPEC_G00328950 [Dallia pectoralis]|uniref:Uncharacterized protein n=1 Tax=Dallia pectoralis TaxID=75939 RepID=A0ACC2F8Q7_DALPE|nr:hypothetical protein DPEC_G00328950 [Dallia pectoralis]